MAAPLSNRLRVPVTAYGSGGAAGGDGKNHLHGTLHIRREAQCKAAVLAAFVFDLGDKNVADLGA